MKVWKKFYMVALALGLSWVTTESARAADYSDGTFPHTEVVTTLSKVGYQASTNYVSLVVTGEDSSGNTVTLTLKITDTSDSNLTLLMEDCNKKASLAMASPSKFSFGFQFDDLPSQANRATSGTNSSTHTYSVNKTTKFLYYELECYLTPASS